MRRLISEYIRYTTKDDKEYLESECHPDLKNAPQTQGASRARITEIGGNEKRGKKTKRERQPQLSIYEVSQVAVQKGIKSRLDLLFLANQQEKEGKEKLIWPRSSPTAAPKSGRGFTGRMGNGRGSS